MIYWGLLTILMLEYVRPSNYWLALEAVRPNTVVPIAVVLATLLTGGVVSNADVAKERNTRIMGFFLFLVTLSVMTAYVTEWAYDIWRGVLGYLALYWVIVKNVADERRFRGVLRAIVLLHIVVAILNPSVLLNPSQRNGTGSTFLGDGNDFALSLNIAIPMCLYLMFTADRFRRRVFYMVVLGLLILSIVATQSRGGTIALACVALYYWMKSDRKGPTAAIVMVGLLGVYLLAPPEYFERMNTISPEEGSAQGRIQAWKGAWRMGLDSPLIGFGAGHFARVYGASYRTNLDGPHVQTAHSVYFLALGELGFPGLFFVLYLIFANLAANRSLSKALAERGPPESTAQQRAMLATTSASLIGFATAGAFLSVLYYPHMYILAGLLAASRRLAAAPGATEALDVAQPKTVSLHWALRPASRTALPAARSAGAIEWRGPAGSSH